MLNPDAHALKNSDLNPFLFASVGTESNGSVLTILSLLARLGSDPWTEAERLAVAPKVVATDWLAERIARSQPAPQAAVEARAAALRLIPLLPARPAGERTNAEAGATKKRSSTILMIVWFALALGLAANWMQGPAPSAPPDQAMGPDR